MESELRVVERREDMSQHGKLKLLLQPDGDVVVGMFDADGMYSSVEFCASGGSSPATLAALRGLFDAMQADNSARALEQREAVPVAVLVGELVAFVTHIATALANRDGTVTLPPSVKEVAAGLVRRCDGANLVYATPPRDVPEGCPESPSVFSYDAGPGRLTVSLRWPDGRVLPYKLDTSRYTDTPEVIAAAPSGEGP